MCTIMTFSETKPADWRSVAHSRQDVELLMEYDRQLGLPFTREELRQLFGAETWRWNKHSVYAILQDSEKAILRELDLVPSPEELEKRPWEALEAKIPVAVQRRKLKCDFVPEPHFSPVKPQWETPSYFNRTGLIFVWKDAGCFGNSRNQGYYYVRYRNSILDGHGQIFSTAYAHPVLVVKKSKLDAAQIAYLERKCQETRELHGQEYTL